MNILCEKHNYWNFLLLRSGAAIVSSAFTDTQDYCSSLCLFLLPHFPSFLAMLSSVFVLSIFALVSCSKPSLKLCLHSFLNHACIYHLILLFISLSSIVFMFEFSLTEY